MYQLREKKFIDITFNVSLILKAINAALEIFFGVLAMFVTQEAVINIATLATQDELTENPSSRIANYVMHSANLFSVQTKHFIIFYLLSHGIIKLFLVVSLLRKKLWAYPASLAVFSVFILYQLYRFSHTYSWWLIALSLFDLLVLLLIWKEYSYLKKSHTSL